MLLLGLSSALSSGNCIRSVKVNMPTLKSHLRFLLKFSGVIGSLPTVDTQFNCLNGSLFYQHVVNIHTRLFFGRNAHTTQFKVQSLTGHGWEFRNNALCETL
mgnify:CR=1 FL=1